MTEPCSHLEYRILFMQQSVTENLPRKTMPDSIIYRQIYYKIAQLKHILLISQMKNVWKTKCSTVSS